MASNLSLGANPTATFANDKFPKSPAASPAMRPSDAPSRGANWAAPEKPKGPLEELRGAVQREEWDKLHAEGKTQGQVSAEWAASPDRCGALRALVSVAKASRAIEVGAFCGVGTLAIADALPDAGHITSIERDPYLCEFAQKHIARSEAAKKIKSMNAEAKVALQEILEHVKAGQCAPFDFAIIDADKASSKEYFDMLWSTPGVLSEKAVVCLDTTPFKGQPPKRYIRFGAESKWVNNSGQEDIDALRVAIQEMPDVVTNEFGGLLVVQRKSG